MKKILFFTTLSSFFVITILPGFRMRPEAGVEKINEDSLFIATNYDKQEFQVPMRDGIKLFTVAYVPKDKSKTYPFLLNRTPYSLIPYGEGKVKTLIGPSMLFVREKFIIVYQDVRGRFMSEGEFVNMRPYIPVKKSKNDIDETTDTFDTIEWLIKNLKENNGKAGMWGISYPGFYTSMGIIDAHPALAAASPQAPIADWFRDDFYHYGAFFLPHAFNFFAVFGRPRPVLTKEWGKRFNHRTPDGYRFFLEEIGALQNVNPKYFHDSIPFWNEAIRHPNDDGFWKQRDVLPHFKNIKPAILVVGGWYDAEDLYGTLKTYLTIEKQNPGIKNSLVMGPWRHGGWAKDDGSKLGNIFFGDSPPASAFYHDSIEFPFFLYHLKGQGNPNLPEAFVFETGINRWRKFQQWPPGNTEHRNIYLHADEKLSFIPPDNPATDYDEFTSDPAKPVPFTEAISTEMTKEYMTDDQRFASKRPDVIFYQTEVLNTDLTLAGNIIATLFVSTSATDADWVVKIIDVYPDSAKNSKISPIGINMGGYQQMVRSEVIRGRFRNSLEKPEPFIPGQISKVSFELQDVLHTFQKGHRLMIQVQSSWFPLVDRNPQKFVENIFFANDADFIKATHRVYHSKDAASLIEVGVLK